MIWRALLLASLISASLLQAGCRDGSEPVKTAAVTPSAGSNLTDQYGRALTPSGLKGKPSLLFFGFTSCADICPTTLVFITDVLKALGPDAGQINVAFVTVDPERDTPAQMRNFMSSFDGRIRGFTGSPQVISKFARDYDAPFRKIVEDNGSYTMEHSSLIYMLDREARAVGVLTPGSVADAAPRVRQLISGAPEL